MKSFALSFCLVLISNIFGPMASAENHKTLDAVIAFGDSLSDNAFDDGHGFRRYSNGKVWVEYLGESLGVGKIEVRAWGGALSGQGNYNAPAKDWSGLLWQVENYQPQEDLDKTLFTLEIGLNDLHDPTAEIKPQQVVENIRQALTMLADKGAKHILVWNLPTSITPPGYTDADYEWHSYYAPLKDQALALFKEFNTLIGPALAEFEAARPETKIHFFDFDAAMDTIKTRFQNTDSPWLGTYQYPEPTQWLWWDHWHFMTETHRQIAEQALNAISLGSSG